MPHFSNAAATVIGSVLGDYYYHHASIEEIFAEAGAPGDAPEGSCARKCVAWLRRTAADPSTPGLAVLGGVLEELMDTDLSRSLRTEEAHSAAKERVAQVLQKEGLEYLRGGRIAARGTTLPVRQLDDLLRSRDLGGVNHEFERALDSVSSDPAAAVTAACALMEALCKVYIEDERLEKPSDQSLQPLWRVVQTSLGLDPKVIEDADLRQILSGLTAVIQGLAAFRTHAGSAHGRGRKGYRLSSRHARLVVNAAHTISMFVIETWDARRQRDTA